MTFVYYRRLMCLLISMLDCYHSKDTAYNNHVKARTGIYIKNIIKYIRRSDLEGQNSGLVIIDVELQSTVRIIGVYRAFNPPGNVTQHAYFTTQLNLIKQATENARNMKIIILGDFNLNETLRYSNDYSHKSYFDELNPVFDNLGLIQLVDFITWRRLVNGVWRTSILDLI